MPCVVRETVDDSVGTDLSAETMKDDDGDERSFREREDSPPSERPFNILYRCTVCAFSATDSETLSYHNTTQHESVLQEPDGLPLVPACTSLAEHSENVSESRAQVDSHPESRDIRAVSVNGTIIIPEPTCHVAPLLRRPPDLSTTPTLAVPLYTHKYNPDLDSNSTLMASFNRFPYPTHAELSWLTAASKHPEEQIRVWFTTQRLKQGITWSPEEVEEARKKLFNGSVWPARHTSPTLGQSDGHVTEQSGTVTGTLQPSLQTSDTKRRSVCESLLTMPPLPAPASPESQSFKIPVVASKEKRPVERPAVVPKQRLPLTPLVSTNLKRSADRFSDNSYKNQCLPSHVSRPTIIQTPRFPDAAFESLRTSSTNVLNGDAWFGDVWSVRERSVPAHFPLLERVKGKSPGQMKVLEESFQKNSFPSLNEVDHLMITTRLSREEIESWFLERRALRDDLEQALLNSMGSKKEPLVPFSPVLKNVFVQTPWPVELQKGFVRRFGDRSSGLLEQNGWRAADGWKRKALAEENVEPDSAETEDRLHGTPSQRWPDASGGEGELSGVTGVCGGVAL